MFGSTAVRIYIVAGVVLLTYGATRLVQGALDPPDVAMPTWSFEQLPRELGPWQGKKIKLDPLIATATGADRIVDRQYRDDAGHVIAMHTAMFKRPEVGVYHSPLNCYRSQGWQKIKESRPKLSLPNGLEIPVCLTTWQHDNERVMVVYWYQLGEHVLFGRLDLGLKVRWSLRGKPKWPALLKVMLQVPAPDVEDARTTILGFAERVAAWENLPEHRKEAMVFDTAEKGR
ncbi:MAG: EpsI family protein [Planctomycetaceae bacterium]|nr:EpsI family protein [Planctomycetaceae bacterium]